MADPTRLPFEVEGRPILLIDDVLYTGRTTRAVINELFDSAARQRHAGRAGGPGRAPAAHPARLLAARVAWRQRQPGAADEPTGRFGFHLKTWRCLMLRKRNPSSTSTAS